MADCLQMTAASVGNWQIASRSPIFTAVRNMVNVDTDGVSGIDISPPDFSKLKFNVPVSNRAKAELQDPGLYSRNPIPTGEFTEPSLESVAYNAVSSAINYVFNSPTLTDIGYLSGLDHKPLPEDVPEPPPLNYPQSGLLPIPPEPTGLTTEAPDIVDTSGKPDLTPIDFEAYEFSGLEPLEFTGDLPVYESPDVSEMPWQEEIKYEDDAALRAKIERLMEGDDEAGQWVQGVVQNLLYEDAIRRLDFKTKRQTDEVLTSAAARNFSLPAGPFEEAIAAISEDELNEAFEQGQSVRDEVFDAAINAVTSAISNSMQIERYHFALYVRYVRQNLSVYQNNVALATDAYNTLARIVADARQFVRARVDAYNQYVSGIEAENRAAASQVEFSQAELDTYQARVGMYRADVGLQRKQAQINQYDVRQQGFVFDTYASQLRGTLANLQIVDQNVGAFRAAIQAHDQYSKWYEEALSAWESAVTAEASKADVNSSKFAAYRQLWSGEQTRMSSYEDYVRASTSQFESELRNFRSAAQTQQGYLSSVNDSLRSSLQAISSFSGAAERSQQHLGDYNAAKTGYTAASNDVDIADSVVDMTQDAITAEAETQYAKLEAAEESSRLDAAGALAQTASSIFGVNISARGDSSERISGRSSGGRRHSVQDRKSFDKSCSEVIRPVTG